jgi:membrane protease YdiL (CAAX protease family)
VIRAMASEQGATLALLPIAATIGYYLLPLSIQEQTVIQFVPQGFAYLAFGIWARRNDAVLLRLGLESTKVWTGVLWGILTGLLLGSLNTFIILSVYPSLGYDINFLKATPHAQIPVLIMVPWFICGIAIFVELNFRGFLLGRLASLESAWCSSGGTQRFAPLALLVSTGLFAFDPFMVQTFQYLHWIAVWDGLIWGALWLRTTNLYGPIVAHAIEVIVMYTVVRSVLL